MCIRDSRRTALGQHVIGLPRPFGKNHAKGGGATDRRGAAHHHVLDRLCDLLGGTAGDVLLFPWKEALVEQFQAIALPADRLDLQTTRSLPPSTGTCAAVVLAKSGPHISAASSATSLDATSVFSRFFVLYCSMVML